MFSRLLRAIGVRRGAAPVLSPLDAYALWSASYPPEAHNPLMRLEQQAVLELLPDARGQTALDLACGGGRYLKLLRERGVARVVGLDLSPQMLHRAKTLAADLVRADLLALPFPPSTFDLIVCGLAVGHVPALPRAVAEMSRALIPGGFVVYSDFHPFGALAGWKRTFRANGRQYAVRHHFHLYADHLAACRAAGLEIEDVREPRIDVEHEWRGCPAVLVVRAKKIVNG
jgi:malonyl-CoA O-methyltransferase